MGAPFLLRRSRPEEATQLTELAIRSKRSWGYEPAFMDGVLADMLVSPSMLEREEGLVAEESGSIRGYAIVRFEGQEAVLRDLFIEPDQLRRGLGKFLFDAVVRLARERGALAITLESDPHAVGFYKRMGMQRVGSTPSVVPKRVLPIMRLKL